MNLKDNQKMSSEIAQIVDSLDSLEYLVIFMGAGASMEGKRNGESFPGFGQLIEEVLKNAGFEVSINDSLQDNYIRKFIKYVQQQGNPSKYLRKYLEGDPGAAHYHLAALSKALIHDFSVKTIFLTTNYDELVEKSLEEIGANPKTVSLHFDSSKDEAIFNVAHSALEQGRPVVMHLLGDLKEVPPALYQDEINRLSNKSEEILRDWMSNRMLVIGYSFQDDQIKQLLFDSSGNSKNPMPVHLVAHKPNLPRPNSQSDRSVIPIEKKFGEFVILLLNMIYKRANEKPQGQNHETIKKTYEAQLKQASSENIYNFDFFLWRTNLSNEFTCRSILPKISGKDSIDFSALYVDRRLIDWDVYLSDKNSLAVILGDAGLGKSCFMYMNTIAPPTDSIPLLILPETIRGGFKKRLSETFLCSIEHMEALMNHFNQLLYENGKFLIILVDAINEAGDKEGRDIKWEFEEFFRSKNWQRIKLVYTCRSYYWNSFLPPTEKKLIEYHSANTFNLEKFNDEQVQDVFKKYKLYYGFMGDWGALAPDFREKLKDPLMLRFLAEGYKGRQIPSFAPAVNVFSEYINSLKDTDPHKSERNLKKHLIEIGHYYWRTDVIKGSMSVIERELERFLLCRFGNLPLKGLLDANVIYEEDGMIQFFSERFFEFVLGLSLIEKEMWLRIPISAESIYNNWELCQKRPYSFTFGLKSALIYLSIKHSGDIKKDLLADGERLRTLLGAEKPLPIDDAKRIEFRSFILYVLRELMTEIEDIKLIDASGYELLKEHVGNDEFEHILLEIGRDDPRSLPYQIDLLFRDELQRKREVAFNFINLIRDRRILENLETTVQKKFQPELLNHIEGVFYLLPVYFERHHVFNKDPLSFVRRLLQEPMWNFSTEQHINYHNSLSEAIYNISKKEGPMFFGGDTRYCGIGYIWSMGKREKAHATTLSRLFLNVPPILNKNDKEVIRFFGSELLKWKDINIEFSSNYKEIRMRRWEYFMAKWTVVMLAKKSGFAPVLDFLQYCIDSNLWLCLDFALCTMEHVLCTVFKDDKETQERGLNKMKEWVYKAEEQCPGYFYHRLDDPVPLEALFNPLSQIAGTQAVMAPASNLKFLDECLQSDNPKKVKLALLSLRKVARFFPKAGMKSLKIAWDIHKNDSVFDDQYRNWLYTAIKELRYLYPKMVEDLLNNMVHANPTERACIERVDASAQSNEYKINSFYQMLSDDKDLRIVAMDWYCKMLYSRSYKDFCDEIAHEIIKC